MYLKERIEEGRSIQARIGRLYEKMKKYSTRPELYYGINGQRASIEYLVARDLAAGLGLSGAPEERARRFLLQQYRLFDVPQRKLKAQLYLKKVLRSRMGTHCIFELRADGEEEVADNCFAVHLDHEDHVVMVSSVYQSDTPEESIGIAPGEWDQALKKALQEFIKQEEERRKQESEEIEERLVSRVHAEPMWIPDWQRQEHVPRLQVKLTVPDGNRVLLVTPDGRIDRQYTVHGKAALGQTGVGLVYRDFWSPKEKEDGVKHHKSTKTVVLRDLESEGELAGRYVAVQDYITRDEGIVRSYGFLDKPRPDSSLFDRVMAYYHIDLIQRYFRELGLDVLDEEYRQFNPIRVVLNPRGETYYSPYEQKIYIHGLHPKLCVTDAREARVLYHEFVHAVTDALARLHRQDKQYSETPRYKQALQAAAIDEGSADYIACSLAARHGVGRAHFGVLELDENTLSWNVKRTLGLSRHTAYVYKFRDVTEAKEEDLHPDIVYEWGEYWGRYLWKLRCKLGAEVTDTLVAHSFFFLTRWSTFGMGVLAIMLADRLLFDGHYEKVILDAGKGADWERWKEDEEDDGTTTQPAVAMVPQMLAEA
jgi:hypothetical protein